MCITSLRFLFESIKCRWIHIFMQKGFCRRLVIVSVRKQSDRSFSLLHRIIQLRFKAATPAAVLDSETITKVLTVFIDTFLKGMSLYFAAWVWNGCSRFTETQKLWTFMLDSHHNTAFPQKLQPYVNVFTAVTQLLYVQFSLSREGGVADAWARAWHCVTFAKKRKR